MAKKKRTSRGKQASLELPERTIALWRLAIFKLRKQLEDECLTHPAERRRLQNQRLAENLHAEIGSSSDPMRAAVMAYWLFCGSPWQGQLGYDDARQQHYAELKALGLPPELQPENDAASVVTELFFRLDSLACWIEAQDTWVFWRAFKPGAWDRDDPTARKQAIVASLIASMPTAITDYMSDWAIAWMVKSFKKWNHHQWMRILNMAARIAAQADHPATEVETWIWWRYPIFSRYRWSTAEVCRAATRKFGEIDPLENEAAFQSAWVRRGLRFTGRKTRRSRPTLWDFVISEKVPKNVSLDYPLLTSIPYEKSVLQS